MKLVAIHSLGLVSAALLAACGGGSSGDPTSASGGDALQATVTAQGVEIVGPAGSAFDGLRLSIPAGAAAEGTVVTVRAASAATALPVTAVGCGPAFSIEPAGLKLTAPATLTLPFDEDAVNGHDRFDDEVKVWAQKDGAWGQILQTESSKGQVTIALDALTVAEAGVNPPAESDIVRLVFHPNAKFAPCFAAQPNDGSHAPEVIAEVVRGSRNDGLFLRGKNIKPGLAFDLFTVQNSALAADGTPDPNFKNFGLAWYQSDLEASGRGEVFAALRTIFLDQIFGFDPAVGLAPTGTFEVGFWFNDPQDAVACGFDATKPTPFNGEHKAGPLAMITVPDATTGLGPLCTKPDTSVSPAQCSP